MKFIDLDEFRAEGFLLEANRRFFHPLGLALAVSIDDASGKAVGMCVQDHRDDPEGVMYEPDVLSTPEARKQRDAVQQLGESKRLARLNLAATETLLTFEMPRFHDLWAVQAIGDQQP